MAISLVVDDVDISVYGFTVKSLSGWLSGPQTERAALSVPGLAGQLPASLPAGSLRVIRAVLYDKLTQIAQRESARAVLEDLITGEHLLSAPDRLGVQTRVVGSVIDARSVAGNANWWPGASSLDIDCLFVAYDGASYDRELRTLAVGTERTPLVLGTLPVDWYWTIPGPLAAGSSVTLRWRGMTGAELGSMTLTAPVAVPGVSAAESLGTNELLELDGFRKTIRRVLTNEARVSAEHWLTGGYWFAPDPKAANRIHGAHGFLTQTTGGGVFTYRPAWAI